MTRYLPVIIAALILWPASAWAADQIKGDESPAAAVEKPQPPSFAPGAAVTLALTILPPEQWQLNYLVPLRLQFDEEYLEDAPFSVEQAVWDFSFKSYMPRYTAEIPIQLDPSLADGPLAISLEVFGSICEASGESCTLAKENLTVELMILSEAPPDTENQALSKGTAEDTLRLSLP